MRTPDAGDIIAGGTVASILVKEKSGTDNSMFRGMISLGLDEQTATRYVEGILGGSLVFWVDRIPDRESDTVRGVFKRWHASRISITGLAG